MIVGVPKEIRDQEYRIGIVPEGVEKLTAAGHTVLVEKGAGEGTGLSNNQLSAAGAKIVDSHADLYARSDMVLKIKQPVESEYDLLREGQILFCYLHLAAEERLTRALLGKKVVGIAFETMETESGVRPLLVPMSQVAGRLAVLEGAKYLHRTSGGSGTLLARIEGVPPASVVIIGVGAAGFAAAEVAASLGLRLTLIDVLKDRLQEVVKALRRTCPLAHSIKALPATRKNISEAVKDADLVVGAVLRLGDRAPWVITRDMLKTMKKGAVIVDVSIDQGGCVETSHPTTHAEPVFEVDGILHYCVANMPGCVPTTSTYAIARLSIPFALKIANKGWKRALKEDRTLARGLNVCQGSVTYEPIANLFKLPYVPVDRILV